MPDLLPVSGDPFAAAGPQLQPVAGDPFDPEGTGAANYDPKAGPMVADLPAVGQAVGASALSGHAGDDLVSWLGKNLPQTSSKPLAYGMAAASMPAVMGARALDAYTGAAQWASDVQAGRYGTDVTDPASQAAIMPGAVQTAMAMGAPGMHMAEEGALGAAGGKAMAKAAPAEDPFAAMMAALDAHMAANPIQERAAHPRSLPADQLVQQAPDGHFLAFHGSPASFDRFSLDHLGSGEGVQAQGHGMYFATDQDVGAHYADTYGQPRTLPDGSTVNGHMYQVAIPGRPEDFFNQALDLSEQSPAVRAAAAPLYDAAGVAPDARGGNLVYEMRQRALEDGVPLRQVDQYVSRQFQDAGIPGHSYSGDGGLPNYVVFDPTGVQTLKMYAGGGSPEGAVAAGALGSAERAASTARRAPVANTWQAALDADPARRARYLENYRNDPLHPTFIDPEADSWRLYHGTKATQDFSTFDPASGAASRDPREASAAFFSPSPSIAEGFTVHNPWGPQPTFQPGDAGPRILPVDVDPGRSGLFDINQMVSDDPSFRKALSSGMPQGKKRLAANLLSESVQANRGSMDQVATHGLDDAISHPQFMFDNAGLGRLNMKVQGHIADMARAQGLDTAVIRGLKEDNGGDQVMVLTPNRVRSAIDGSLLYSGGGSPEGAVAAGALQSADRAATASIPAGRRLTVPSFGERMTRDQVNAEIERYKGILADANADPGASKTMTAMYQNIHDDLQSVAAKFDQPPTGIVGKPFAPAVVDANGKSIVSALVDPRHGASEDELNFYAYQNNGGYTADSPPSRAAIRNQMPIGSTTISQHPDGRWEVGMVQVDPKFQRQGVATDMYSAIERHTGQPMIPSGTLLPDGLAMWQKRNPELVKNYYDDGFAHYSPNRLKELGSIQGGRYQAAFDALPEEAKTPEALRRTFVGGAPGGALTAGEAPQPDGNGLLTQFLRRGGGA